MLNLVAQAAPNTVMSGITHLTCTSSVGPALPPPTPPALGQEGFHARWYGQSGYMNLCPGEQATATVAYYNSGSKGWSVSDASQTAFLGTSGPQPGQDAGSLLGGDGQFGTVVSGWPRFNRVAVQTPAYVAPGEIGWFQFTIRAPADAGTYKLHLRPLIEGVSWMDDEGVSWSVTVAGVQTEMPSNQPITLPVATLLKQNSRVTLPAKLVALTDARNGYLSVTSDPLATCSGVSRFPDGVTVLQLGSKVTLATGLLSWIYMPSPTTTLSATHELTCSKKL